MKFIKFFLLLIFIIGCKNATDNKTIVAVKKTLEIDSNNIIHKDSLVLNGNEGNWYYKNKLYNGFAVKYHKNDTLSEKTGFYNGKKQGVYRVWYKTGMLKLRSHYNQNALEGNYKTWWSNGFLASDVSFIKGKKEGVEKQWYNDGTLSKERNLLNGQEEGLQRAWLQNGKIYVNYEAKNGRTFGMKRANLCYQLKDEKVEERKKI
ncbi:toxin-antitoxin system YwqK family antitoxin [Polaribacter sp. Asnod1-A03]|uniref:toxin-antitoxin system YwqK family antitoxin n=1 Tax=Polaribacter sp. Asnod1-A03 TaxID=3160581 RepID=UPI00386D11D6